MILYDPLEREIVNSNDDEGTVMSSTRDDFLKRLFKDSKPIDGKNL